MKVVWAAGLALTLALGSLAGSLPAAGATAGFHAAYFSESAFLTLAPGESGQFSVGYANTGTEPWVKGITGRQASLHTAAPLDNPADSVAGWGPTWVAANIYANQQNELVAPDQIGFFVYTVKVPPTQALGAKTFYGRPAIDGVGFMEDYGYYQVVTVTGGLRVTSVTPTSPSTNNMPTIAGTDAVPNEPVTITDGTSGPTVAATFADANGIWSATLTSGLTSGAHSLYANSVGKGQSAAIPYTVSGLTGPIVVAAYATTLNAVQVQFSAAMKCTSTTDRTDMTSASSYFLTEEPSGASGPTVNSSTASSDCLKATLSTNALTAGKTYRVQAIFLRDQGGNSIDSAHNSGTFTIGAPALRTASAKSDGTLTVYFSKSMDITSGTSGGNSVLNPNNYTVDSSSASAATTSCHLAGLNGCLVTKLTFTGGTSSVLGAANSTHTIGVTNVIDAISGGQIITPNPSNRSVPTT